VDSEQGRPASPPLPEPLKPLTPAVPKVPAVLVAPATGALPPLAVLVPAAPPGIASFSTAARCLALKRCFERSASTARRRHAERQKAPHRLAPLLLHPTHPAVIEVDPWQERGRKACEIVPNTEKVSLWQKAELP
jgi:hypothetical protein